jgi:hypothetical protein
VSGLTRVSLGGGAIGNALAADESQQHQALMDFAFRGQGTMRDKIYGLVHVHACMRWDVTHSGGLK